MSRRLLGEISRGWRAVVFLALALILTLGVAGEALAQPPEMVRVIIGFEHQPGKADWSLVRGAGGSINHDFDIINAYSATVPQWAIDWLKSAPGVAFVEEDAIVHATQETLPWGVDRIDADLVWPSNTGSGIKVAIVDTGIDYDHPDLAANFDPMLQGYDFVNSDADPMDDHGHGTHCAGIVAALDNEIGVIGVAPGAELYAVKVLDSSGSGSLSDVIAGIEWCVDHDIQIISMSLGTDSDYDSLRSACDAAYSQGLLLVAAAGNDGSWWSTRDTVDYPAKYDSVIAVAATDQNDQRAVWGWRSASSTGPAVELAAPGDSIYSTYWNDAYATKSGTSMACPHVAGTAALVWAAYPSYSNAQVRERLQETAEDLGTYGRDNEFGFGLVDAEAAAEPPLIPNDPPVAEANGPYPGDEGSPITFDASGSDDPDGTITLYEWDWDNNGVYDDATSSPTIAHTWSDDYSGAVALRVTDNSGATATDTASVTVSNVAPMAEAGGPYSGDEGSPIALSGSATDPGADTLTYAWDLDYDGEYDDSGAQNPSWTWASEGIYTVGLRVSDDDGGVGYDTATVDVADLDPAAAFSYSPASPIAGEPVSFSDESTSYDGIASWAWEFDDGANSGQRNPSHTYAAAGTYTVNLTVTEADGDSDIASQDVHVAAANQPPVADAGGSYTGDEGSPITFNASGSDDPDGTITLYEWDWDNNGAYDDATSSPTFAHTWSDDLSGTVVLRVTDDSGATGTDTASVTVSNVAPTAEAGGPYSGDEGSPITLSGTATDPGADTLTYAWDLDYDGEYDDSGAQNPSWTWASEGIYTVGLRVSDDDGGEGYDTATVTITAPPSGDENDIYVWSIDFSKSGWWWFTSLYITVTISSDSNANGIAEEADAEVADAAVTLLLKNTTTGQSWQAEGTTSSDGQVTFRLRRAPSGTYVAEVTGLVHDTYSWNKGLDAENPSDPYTLNSGRSWGSSGSLGTISGY